MTITMLDEPRLKIPEIAAKCRVDPDTVRRWIATGVNGVRLRQVRIGRGVQVRVSDLEAFLSAMNGDDEPAATSIRTESATQRAIAAADRANDAAGW